MGHLSHTTSLRFRNHHRRGGRKIVRAKGLERPEQNSLLDIIRPQYSWTHSSYPCKHQTCIALRQATFEHGDGKGSWAPPLTETILTVEK